MNISLAIKRLNHIPPFPRFQEKQPSVDCPGRFCHLLQARGCNGISGLKTGLAMLILAFYLCCPCASATPGANDELDPLKFKEYRAKAALGDASAQADVGNCFLQGVGVEKDAAEAVKWLRKAAEQGYADAQYRLGICYLNGEGVAKDAAEAVKWLRITAEHGHAGAQFQVGLQCEQSNHQADAYAWYHQAAKTIAAAERNREKLGRSMSPQQIADAQKRAKELQMLIEEGTAESWYGWYCHGDGIAKDVKWLRMEAEQGDAVAQFNLGKCYQNGEGVAKETSEAVKWFRNAAEQGNSDAQCYLGICYANGEGIVKDTAEGMRWLRKAAEQGDAGAQFSLGLNYQKGEGVQKDAAEAVKWLRKAAEQGYAEAQCNLGGCYLAGEGAPKDQVEAYAWYHLAAKTIATAANSRDQLDRTLSPQQLADAKKRIKELQTLITAAPKSDR